MSSPSSPVRHLGCRRLTCPLPALPMVRGTVTCPRLGKFTAFLEGRRFFPPSAMPGSRRHCHHFAGFGLAGSWSGAAWLLVRNFPSQHWFAMCLRARPRGWPFPPSLCEVGLYEHSGCGGIFQVSVWSPPPVCDRPSGLVTPRECLRLSACVLIRSRGVSPFLAPSLFADCGAPGGFGRCTPSRPIRSGLFWGAGAGGPRKFRGQARAGAWSPPRASSALGQALRGAGGVGLHFALGRCRS